MDRPPTPLYLPHSLSFPLTITRLLASTPRVRKTSPLFSFSYLIQRPDGSREREVKVWESPVEGEVVKWGIKEGDVLKDASQPVLHIQEPCTHDVQLHGLCALCGKDLTVIDYTGFSDTSRAEISMVHDVGGLTVSLDEAHRLETATTKRLLSSQKLSLIVDLDQTIVHATVDPTVGEWLEDPLNPNFGVLEGVQRFKLGNSADERSEDGCWYYVKMRPGLGEFLKGIAEMYEMHVYTMGTRAYAAEVCKIIDPDGGLFGGRILSRDESGSMTRKSLQRLFPCDTSMVVIIDDRADVWDGSPNLVKVVPYEFFVGIGDINAAFLPKKKELAASKRAAAIPPAASTSSTPIPDSSAPSSPDSIDISVLEASSAPTSPALSESAIVSPALREAEASNALALHDQIESRPLSKTHKVHKEHEGHGEGEVVDLAEEEEEGEDELDAVLTDDDVELDRLFGILKSVHTEFFADVASGSADVKTIIPAMKRRVFAGVVIVFSGVVALGTKPQDSDYWKTAETFGAKCLTDIRGEVTHVVANQSGTAKVHAARKVPRIKVVWDAWFLTCVAQWERIPELPWLIDLPSLTPSSPIAPRLSDEEDDLPLSQSASVVGDNLDIGNVDWGDAWGEIDDFLNETDEEEDPGDVTDGSTASAPRKRRRPATDSEDEGSTKASSSSNGVAPAPAAAKVDSIVLAGSPLQKRVKTSRSRKSRLKVSFPAAEGEEEEEEEEEEAKEDSSQPPVEPAPPAPRPPAEVPPPGDGYEASQGSSSLDSDDDAFFASMAAEVESGWS